MKNLVRINKKKTVLIVEDNETRIEWFRKRLDGMNVTVCTTPEKALNVLGAHRFDIVFLDHDAVPVFIEYTDPDCDSKTFRRVARLLAQTQYDGTVIIHSWNQVGAKQMAHWLGRTAEVYVMPFDSFEIEQEY